MIASLTFAFVLLAPTGVMAPAQECELDCMTDTPADQQAIADFRAAAEEYATLHRRLERALMLDHYASWPEEGDMESETLADVIRAARPDGRAGAFFKPTIRELPSRISIQLPTTEAELFVVQDQADDEQNQAPGYPSP